MAKILDQPRYKCALAAMQTVQAITGAIPILHSGFAGEHQRVSPDHSL